MDRPVAMKSNLHSVLFETRSTRLWVANASKDGEPAVTQPYHAFQLTELLTHHADPGAPALPLPRRPWPRHDILQLRTIFHPNQSPMTAASANPVYASVGGPAFRTSDEPTSRPAITMPTARVLLARVSWWTRRSKCWRSNWTVSSPRLIDSSDCAQHVGQEHGDPLHVLGRPDRLGQEPPGVEPAQGQLADERVELRGDVEVGVERAADALDRHQRADQEHQVGRDVQVVRPDEADQLAEQGPQVDRVERQVGIGRDQLARRRGAGPRVDLLAADLQGVEGAEHAVGVLGEQAGQQVGDPLAGRRGRAGRTSRSRAGRSPRRAGRGGCPGAGRRGRSRTRKIWRSKIRAPRIATTRRVDPRARRSPSRSLTPTPPMNSIAMTRVVENSLTT